MVVGILWQARRPIIGETSPLHECTELFFKSGLTPPSGFYTPTGRSDPVSRTVGLCYGPGDVTTVGFTGVH